MKKIFQLSKVGLVIAVAALSFAACSENYMDEINRDPSVTLDSYAKFLVPDIELRTAQNIVGGDFNTYFGSYVEYWAGTHNQLFKAEKREAEVRTSSTFNNNWGTIYENIRNGKIVIAKCADDGDTKDAGDSFTRGVGEIMLAYNLAVATDVFGDTPYTELGDPERIPHPKIDTQESLYQEVFRLLNAGIDDITNGSNSLYNYDFIYGGNANAWIKFANGLLARYTLRLINRSSNKSADYNKILGYIDNSFASAADQASIQYNTGNQNPMFDFQWSRDGISSCTSMYSKLMARNDPRAERVYYDPYFWCHYYSDEVEELLAPTGDPVECQYEYAYDIFAFAEVAPVHLMSYHELLFIKAEVLCRQNKKEEAKAVLLDAIKASFANFEVNVTAAGNAPSINAYGGLDPLDNDPLTDEDAEAYFTESVVPLFNANPLKETLIQKYIGMWGANGETVETYADVRRLKAEGNDVYGLVNPGKFPLRAPYGQSDVIANPNVTAAYVDAGNYVFTDNVWWAGGTH